jgi:hypothetical protein
MSSGRLDADRLQNTVNGQRFRSAVVVSGAVIADNSSRSGGKMLQKLDSHRSTC